MIIRNRVRCKKCGDIIESKYRHDFVTCKCGAISVDGGKDYLRRSGNLEDYEDLSEVLPEVKVDPKKMDYIEKGADWSGLRFRCFGCGKFWGRCFRRCNRFLRRRFRGGR